MNLVTLTQGPLRRSAPPRNMRFKSAGPSELTNVTSDRSTVRDRAVSSSLTSFQRPLSSSTQSPLSSPSSLSVTNSGPFSTVILSMFVNLHCTSAGSPWDSQGGFGSPQEFTPYNVRYLGIPEGWNDEI